MSWGWLGVAMVLGKRSVPGRPTNLESSRARGGGPFAVAVGAGCLDIFSLVYLMSFLSPSLEDSPIYSEILPQRAVKPKTTNQPIPVVGGMRTPVYSCYLVYAIVSDKHACRNIDSDLTIHSTILGSISRRFVI